MSNGTLPTVASPLISIDDGSGRTRALTQEALAGGPDQGLLNLNAVIALPRWNDDAQRLYGDRIWDCVDKDAAAGSSVELLCNAVLANDPQLVASAQLEPGKSPETPEEQAYYDKSTEVTAWVNKTLCRLRTPFHVTAKTQLREALTRGANVADKVWEVEPDEDGFEQLVLRAIKPKDRRTWLFEVDFYFNLLYIAGVSAGTGWERWPREKFVVLTWGGKGGDPRGESIYSRAVEPWNFKVQIPEDWFRFLKRFGTPKISGNLAPGEGGGGVTDLSKPETSRGLGMLEAMKGELVKFAQGAVLALGLASKVTVHEVTSNGESFKFAKDDANREIVQAILLQSRATTEAQHGSKADSETGQDVLGNMIRYMRKWFCATWTADVLYPIVEYRYGKAIADLHCPTLSLGEVEHQDIMDLMRGLSLIGYSMQPSQFPWGDKTLGAPVRKTEDVEKTPVPGLASAAAGDEQKQEDKQPKPGKKAA